MSVHVARELIVQDVNDEFALTSLPYDEFQDWGDDEGPAIAKLQVNRKGATVLIHRNDLRNLRTFINEVLRKDGDL